MAERPDAVVSITRPTAALSSVGVVLCWTMVLLLDLHANNSAVPILAWFGIPLAVSAIVTQIAMMRLEPDRRSGWPLRRRPERRPDRRLDRRFLWWILGVLPAGVLASAVVAVLGDRDFFIGDESPWMLLFIPVFVGCALLLGLPLWFFVVFPAVTLVRNLVAIARGEAAWSSLLMPVMLLALAAVIFVGASSLRTSLPGRSAYLELTFALLGLPGGYTVTWAPGLWIVRGILLAILLTWAIPAWRAHRQERGAGG